MPVVCCTIKVHVIAVGRLSMIYLSKLVNLQTYARPSIQWTFCFVFNISNGQRTIIQITYIDWKQAYSVNLNYSRVFKKIQGKIHRSFNQTGCKKIIIVCVFFDAHVEYVYIHTSTHCPWWDLNIFNVIISALLYLWRITSLPHRKIKMWPKSIDKMDRKKEKATKKK